MVWQHLTSRLYGAAKRSNRKLKKRQLRLERMERRELLASDLGAIAGVAFVDQAGDGFNTSDPPVLVDNSGNLVAPGTTGAQGIQIQLFEDTNNDNLFDNNDQLIGTDTTDLDGNYRFDGLSVGTYFVQQQNVPQLRTPQALLVEVTNDGGVQTALIDDYSTTTQSLTANANSTSNDSATAPEAIGGSRDIQVTNNVATGQVTVFIDAAADMLSIGSLGNGSGTVNIQYDGADSSSTLSPSGLAGVSLGGGAPGEAVDPNAGLIVEAFAQNAGDSLVITVHSGAGNSSTATIPLPVGTAAVETFVRFSDFVTASGSGADFNNVGAIEANVGLAANNDIEVSIVEARRSEVVQANLSNIQTVTLGGQVFRDNSAGGQNNGIREGSEAGVSGVLVNLYEVATPDGTADPATDTPLASATTGTNGTYTFAGLDPGHYVVVIPANQFSTGAALFGRVNSTGNDPAPDPDNDVNNDDNGTTVNGNVISGTITLVAGNEPVNDDDTNANTNTTLDFGFFPQTDLQITKTTDTANSNITAGGTAFFDIVVTNNGPLEATNVRVEDVIPAGLTFTGTSNTSGTFTTTVNGSTVSVVIGTIPSGGTASFRLNTTIAADRTDDITNTATVTTADLVDLTQANNTDSDTLDLPSSDLRIEKTDLNDPVNAGSQLTYQITVTNDGPDAAAGVVVVDPLPAGVTFVSGNVDGTASAVSFNSTTREVTANVGDMANTVQAVITIVVTVAADSASPLSNTATVSANPNTDPDESNNTSGEDTSVTRQVDVAVQKTVTGTPVAGGTVTYTVAVTNDGPSQARGVTVVDTLDADLTFVTGSFAAGTSGVTLAQNGQTLTFDVGLLDPQEALTFTFDVTIDASATGTIPNQATIDTTDTDSDATNDTDSVDITVGRSVDLILTKTVDQATAVPGQDQLVYTFTVSHDTDSLSDAANVRVTDVLPSGLIGAVISAPTATTSNFANGTVTVDFASLPIGETRTFTVTVDIDEAATGDVVNPASVTSTGTELDNSNNSATATTTLTPDFDVTVTKTVNNATPSPTGTVVYSVVLSNEGPSTATGIVLSDVVPTGLTFVSGTLNGQAGVLSGNTVSFPAISLDDDSTATATLNFTVNSSASGTITNTATVPDRSAAGENDVTNNSGAVNITVTPAADLRIAKNVSATTAQVGSNLTYTITVTNDGPSTATNVVATDTLPAGVTFVSGTGPNGALTATGGVVTVNGGSLASAGSFSFTINATVASGATGNLINTTSVTSDTNDANTANNTASASTTIDPVTASIAGSVYLDANNNGTRDSGETGVTGVTVSLTGTDTLGNAVTRTTTTDASGNYQFSNLPAGTYTVTETQPAGLRDGRETVGTGGTGTATAADNVFTQLGLAAGANATGFNFGELNEPLSKRRFLASSGSTS